MRYEIKNALMEAGSAAPGDLYWGDVYTNNLEFEAESDDAAIKYCRELQDKHDAEWIKRYGDYPRGYDAPCYVAALYNIDNEGKA